MADQTESPNKERMQQLDDAWNAMDLDLLDTFHVPDVIVRWPGQPETHGREAHRQEAVNFFMAFPDQKTGNRPYKLLIAEGDWTCSMARITGTFDGPLRTADGQEIAPTGKSYEVDFVTIAKWKDGQIVEENLMYDLTSFMKQIGLG